MDTPPPVNQSYWNIIPAGPNFGWVTVYIPVQDIAAFKEVVRRGMSFEHGEPASLHKFADDLARIEPTPTTPAGSLFV